MSEYDNLGSIMEKKYFTVKDVADRFGVTEPFIRSEIERGRLHANKIGRVYRISEEDIQAYEKLTHTGKKSEGDLALAG